MIEYNDITPYYIYRVITKFSALLFKLYVCSGLHHCKKIMEKQSISNAERYCCKHISLQIKVVVCCFFIKA
jgi:hypothetical protein